MIQLISKADIIIERLRKEGKVSTLEWTPEQQTEFDKELAKIRRDSRYKQAMSEISASKVWLF